MRFVNVSENGRLALGVLQNDIVISCQALGFEGTLLDLIDAGPKALEELKSRLAEADSTLSIGKLGEVRLAAPIPSPRRPIFCAGKTYADHAAEYAKSGYDKADAQEIPDIPVTFFKLAECVVGPYEAVEAQPEATQEMDYEAELAAILWEGGRGITMDAAADHVFGYVLVNDMTARDWQKGHDQWVVGKSFDGYCPMGPVVVTADEIGSISELAFECFVNDEHRQTGNPEELIFSVPYLVEYFSRGITLQPGDIIATGSPLGPGIGFSPPRFLKPGDTVRIQSDVLGTIETPIV